uniref:(California timema) hypothetical protein n=1 Tax=Timema californicum TaxID=61474 RepID=A0A7R9IW13_TIMCA|nr:unnamed protein product [Timema californicum]
MVGAPRGSTSEDPRTERGGRLIYVFDMWRSNPALAGALLLLLLLLSPAAEAKRVPRRRPRPQAQQPDAPGAGTDDFNYEEGYDEYPDYYEELEFGKTSTSTSTTTTTTTTTPPPPPPPPIEVQPIGQVAPVDVPETTLPPEPVEPSPQPPSRAVSPPQPDSRVGPDRKEPFSCTFEGRQYANLEEWEPDACTSCQCLRGQVECSQQQPCSSGRDTEFAT